MAAIEVSTLLAAIRQCVTVVGPGEVLAVRIRDDIPPEGLDVLREQAQAIRGSYGIQVLFVCGEEFARLKAGDAP